MRVAKAKKPPKKPSFVPKANVSLSSQGLITDQILNIKTDEVIRERKNSVKSQTGGAKKRNDSRSSVLPTQYNFPNKFYQPQGPGLTN